MLLRIYPENPNPRDIRTVVECLQDGGVIIYPTDTVYGIGCDIYKQKAVERVARLKGMKLNDAKFSIICHDLSHISDYVKTLDNPTFKLMKKALPGPYTFILNANTNVPKLFYKPSKKHIGIRVPDNNIPRAIVEELGNPIVTTSLLEDEEAVEYTTNPELIYERYQNDVDIVIDGGIGNLVASTIINCTTGEPELIREGAGDVNHLF